MNSPMEGHAFLFMWIGFLLLMSGGIGAFFLWGIRAGQFSNQDRARYLALQSGIPEEVPPLPRPPLKGVAGGCRSSEEEEKGEQSGREAP